MKKSPFLALEERGSKYTHINTKNQTGRFYRCKQCATESQKGEAIYILTSRALRALNKYLWWIRWCSYFIVFAVTRTECDTCSRNVCGMSKSTLKVNFSALPASLARRVPCYVVGTLLPKVFSWILSRNLPLQRVGQDSVPVSGSWGSVGWLHHVSLGE